MGLIRSDVLKVSTLGPRRFPTPVRMSAEHFVDDERRVLVCTDRVELQEYLDAGLPPASFLPAGPRTELFFDPSQLTCGIVTCGGLCPGLNDVIRALTLTLIHRYGVLEPGDRIVLVLTASRHRQAAFEAAEFLMDYLKTSAPFWKKEDHAGGSRWVDARDADDSAAARWKK